MEFIHLIMPILCICFGFYTGYKLGKEKELPKVPEEIKHPIQTIKDNIETKKAEREENERLEELQEDLAELDAYDGGIGMTERR